MSIQITCERVHNAAHGIAMVQFGVGGEKWIAWVHHVLPLGQQVAVAFVEHALAHFSAIGNGSRYSGGGTADAVDS